MFVPYEKQAIIENKDFIVSVADATKFALDAKVYLSGTGVESREVTVKDIRSATDLFIGEDVSEFTPEVDALVTQPPQHVYPSREPTYIAPKEEVSKTYVDQQIASLTSQITGKADAEDVYTKGEVDAALGTKANAEDVYTKDEVYTKQEVDDLLNPDE